jgi:Skp family chaperone for outer membrane proteins
MRRFVVSILAISATLLFVRLAHADDEKPAATTQPNGTASDTAYTRIGFYDIDRVAHDMGWATDMKLNLEGLQKEFQSELKQSQKMYSQQIVDQKHHWAPDEADKLTPEQQDALLKMNAFANQVLSSLTQKGSQELLNYRQQWIVQYRRALRPILKQVAEEKKLAVIFEINDTVQYLQPSSDITDTIIDAARAQPPVVTPVPMPTLPAAAPMELKWPSTQPTSQPAGTEPTRP